MARPTSRPPSTTARATVGRVETSGSVGGEPAAGPITTADGRVAGLRGRATRDRLLAAVVELLASTPWRSVKVIDIAREAGTSPATFYQYFENLEHAIGVLAEGMVDEAAAIGELMAGDWSKDASWDTALEVTRAFLEFWEANRAVFRVMDLATEEGDVRLRGVRVRALNAVTVALSQAITQHAPRGRGPIGSSTGSPAGSDPMAIAGTLVAMYASVAAHRYGFEFWGIRTQALVDSQARFLHWAVTGRPGPNTTVGRTPPSPGVNGRSPSTGRPTARAAGGRGAGRHSQPRDSS